MDGSYTIHYLIVPFVEFLCQVVGVRSQLFARAHFQQKVPSAKIIASLIEGIIRVRKWYLQFPCPTFVVSLS